MMNSIATNVYGYDAWLHGVMDYLSNNPLFIGSVVAAGVGLLGAILCRGWLRMACLIVLFLGVCLAAYAC